jgi:hypothetical protein
MREKVIYFMTTSSSMITNYASLSAISSGSQEQSAVTMSLLNTKNDFTVLVETYWNKFLLCVLGASLPNIKDSKIKDINRTRPY